MVQLGLLDLMEIMDYKEYLLWRLVWDALYDSILCGKH